MPQTDIQWAVDDLNGRAAPIAERQAYYDGRHPSMIPGQKTLSRNLRDLLDRLNDNLCDDVVDEPVSRLGVQAWVGRATDTAGPDLEDGSEERPEAESDALGMAATLSWEVNRGDARASQVHRDGWRAGDGWVIVQPDANGGPARWYPQRPECMAARYSQDRPDEMVVAAKAWREGKGWRLNLYYPPADGPDADPETAGKPWVERYWTKGTTNDGAVPGAKSFQPVVEAQGYGQAVEFLDGRRIPVFHFPADNVGGYGRSVLTPTVLRLQDALNKSMTDMVVAMEGHALPDRWATGIQAEYDPVTGEEKPLRKSGDERMFRTGSKEAQLGQFPQTELGHFLDTQKSLRSEIARKGWLPSYSVAEGSGDAPSGLALLIAEGRQVKRVTAAQRDWGVEWRALQAEVLHLSGVTDVTADDLEVEWLPAGTRDEVAELETLTLKVALGLPKAEALIEAGYDPAEVRHWRDEAESRAAQISGGSGVPPLPPAQGGVLPAPPVQPNGAQAPSTVAG